MNKIKITYDLLYFRLDTLNFLTRWVDDSADYSAYAINEKGELTTNDGKVIVATGLKKTALWQCITDMCKGVVTQGKLTQIILPPGCKPCLGPDVYHS